MGVLMMVPLPQGSMVSVEFSCENATLRSRQRGLVAAVMDLAQSMIRLSGAHGIEIVESGLRPGEKLYEELLVKTEELDKTDNNLVFIERDTPLSREEIEEKIQILRDYGLGAEYDSAERGAWD